MTTLLIGVTGGTGHQAVRGLLDAGLTGLRALTRDPGKPTSKALGDLGVELVVGDLEDQGSLDAACADGPTVYLHGLSKDGAEFEERNQRARGARLVAAALAGGVPHVAYNSVEGCDRDSGIAHFEAVRDVEQGFRDAGIPLTAIRVALFMEEWWKHHTRPGILDGTLRLTHDPAFAQQFISVRDLGRVAGIALQDVDTWGDRVVPLAADQCTPLEMAAAFGAAQGSEVAYERLPLAMFEGVPGGAHMIQLVEWFEHHGHQVDIPAARERFPFLVDFRTFLDEADWADPSKPYESFSDGTRGRDARPIRAEDV